MRPGGGEPARLFEAGTEWLRGEGDGSDVVLSSRVRLARNLAGVPFPGRGSPTDRRHALEVCKEAILSSSIGGRARSGWTCTMRRRWSARCWWSGT